MTAATTDDSMAYIGRAPCGCLRLAMVDKPSRSPLIAREVARAIRDGLTVERVTCEFVRTTPWTVPGCTEHARPRAATQAALL